MPPRRIGVLLMSLLLPCLHPALASEHPPLTRKATRVRAPAQQPPSGYEKRADVQRFGIWNSWRIL